MSATARPYDDTPARMPVFVVTLGELEHRVREVLEDAAYESHGYTQSYDYKKTDISSGVGAAVVASRQALTGDVMALGGWCIAETTGAAAAKVRLHDGTGAANELLATIPLAAGAVSLLSPRGRGIEVATGKVFMEVVSGSVEGVIYWR